MPALGQFTQRVLGGVQTVAGTGELLRKPWSEWSNFIAKSRFKQIEGVTFMNTKMSGGILRRNDAGGDTDSNLRPRPGDFNLRIRPRSKKAYAPSTTMPRLRAEHGIGVHIECCPDSRVRYSQDFLFVVEQVP